MTATKQSISPEQASVILERNTHNRIASKATITRYAATMQRGEWKLSNDIICISPDGVLMNGQHRLKAVEESGTTQEFWVWENCPQEALLTMDLGRKRDASDTATLSSGNKISKAKAKALRLINTNFHDRVTITATPNQLILWWEKIGSEIDLAAQMLPKTGPQHSLFIAAATEAINSNPGSIDKVADFFGILTDLAPATDRPLETQGADYIPFQMNKWMTSLHKSNQRFSSFAQYKMLLNALNAYVLGISWGTAKNCDVAKRTPSLPMFNRN